MNDQESEKTHGFSLRRSLDKAHADGGMLSAYRIHVTKNVKPEPLKMRGARSVFAFVSVLLSCYAGSTFPATLVSIY